MTPIRVARKKSTDATKRTVTLRNKATKEVMQMMTNDDVEYQTAAMIKSSGELSREKILGQLNHTVSLTPAFAAAMRACLNIPWAKFREISRWLSTFQIKVPSERLTRPLSQKWTGDGIVVEMAPLIVRENRKAEPKVEPRPWGYLYNIVGHILNRLNNLKEKKMMVHHSHIGTEIHIKIGGDHGGGSFKMSYQVANILNPNKKQNTVVFSLFEAKDSTSNLRICLERFKPQINVLQKLEWQEKPIRVFLFGDYSFLTVMYGLSGASGRHPCLWCKTTSKQMNDKDHIAELRSIPNMQADLEKFRKFDCDLKKAKHCNNVIDAPFFDIPLDQICVPGLHLTLGIFLKMFKMFERLCRRINMKIACIAKSIDLSEEVLDIFKNINKHEEDLFDLEEEHQNILDAFDWDAIKQNVFVSDALIERYNSTLDQLSQQMDEKKKEITNLFNQLDIGDDCGPCMKELDATLKSMGVERQAYHSQSFVGNHCHKMLKPENIKSICSVIKIVINREGLDEMYNNNLHEEVLKFEMAFNRYATCHVGINGNHMEAEAISKLDLDIKSFMAAFRLFRVKVTPKLHILEHHAITFIKKWRCGFGFYGEHGGESIHNEFNIMNKRFSSIKNPIDRVKYIMNQHHLRTSVQSEEQRPKIKRRKLFDSEE